MKTIILIVDAGIIHINTGMFRLYHLSAQSEIPIFIRQQLCFYRIIQGLMPFLLISQTGAVKQSTFKDKRKTFFLCITTGEADITHIAHLLGYKRTIGKILLMGRTMGIDRERYTHLTNRKIQVLDRKHTGIRIKHLDGPLIGQIDLRFIGYNRMYISRNTEAGIPHFKTAFVGFCLELIFSPDRSMNFRQIIFQFHDLLIQLFAIPGIFFSLSAGCCRHQKQGDGCCNSTHSVVCYLIRGKGTMSRIRRDYKRDTVKLQKQYCYTDNKGGTKKEFTTDYPRQHGYSPSTINVSPSMQNCVTCGESINRKRNMRSA